MNKKDGDKISEGVQKMKDCYGETILLMVAILSLALSVPVAFIFFDNEQALSYVHYGISFVNKVKYKVPKTRDKCH